MKIMLLLMAVLAFSASCAAQCSFPNEVNIPDSWLVEYRGVADTLRYSGETVFLEWDDTNKHLLINGDPYPVPSNTEYSDEKWMAVHRYAELRELGKSANEAGRLYEEEVKVLLDRANEEFRNRLEHHIPEDQDPEERAGALAGISAAERDEALAHAEAILRSNPLVDNTGLPTHLNPTTSCITVAFQGRRPIQVRLCLMEAHIRAEYTKRQACLLAERLRGLETLSPGVFILQGGGLRTIRGPNAEKYRASVR